MKLFPHFTHHHLIINCFICEKIHLCIVLFLTSKLCLNKGKVQEQKLGRSKNLLFLYGDACYAILPTSTVQHSFLPHIRLIMRTKNQVTSVTRQNPEPSDIFLLNKVGKRQGQEWKSLQNYSSFTV